MKQLSFRLPACALALVVTCLFWGEPLHAQPGPGSYIMIPWFTGTDAGYVSLLYVANTSMNPYGIAPQTATCTVDAYYQGTHYGPAPLPTQTDAFPAGTLPAGQQETLTEAQIATATGLSLANSGQRAYLYLTCNVPTVNAQMLFVNPGGVVTFSPGVPASPGPVAPSITYPAPNSALSGSAVTFQWSPGQGVKNYELRVSTKAPGDYEIFNTWSTSALQATVSAIPTTGGPVYVRLYYEVNGLWMYTDYTFTQY